MTDYTGYKEMYDDANVEIERLRARVAELEGEVVLADKIIADRNRLLDRLACPAHGQCVPGAIEVVDKLESDRDEFAKLAKEAKDYVIHSVQCRPLDTCICGLAEWHYRLTALTENGAKDE